MTTTEHPAPSVRTAEEFRVLARDTFRSVGATLHALNVAWEEAGLDGTFLSGETYPFRLSLDEQVAELFAAVEALSAPTAEELATKVRARWSGGPLTPHAVARAMRDLNAPVGDATVLAVYEVLLATWPEPKTIHPSVDVLEAAGYPYDPRADVVTWAAFGEWLVAHR